MFGIPGKRAPDHFRALLHLAFKAHGIPALPKPGDHWSREDELDVPTPEHAAVILIFVPRDLFPAPGDRDLLAARTDRPRVRL
jgi:hypothetical protein